MNIKHIASADAPFVVTINTVVGAPVTTNLLFTCEMKNEKPGPSDCMCVLGRGYFKGVFISIRRKTTKWITWCNVFNKRWYTRAQASSSTVDLSNERWTDIRIDDGYPKPLSRCWLVTLTPIGNISFPHTHHPSSSPALRLSWLWSDLALVCYHQPSSSSFIACMG